MVLETTMICLDNSEWMRNGDYIPSRLDAQQDAAELLCNDRTRDNPENTVGILAMAGRCGVDLLVSPTEDREKIASAFARVKVWGTSDFTSSVQIAALALKHRKNKAGGQRIIVFVGSPLSEELPALVKVAKVLKKNNVAVDVISIGEFEDNEQKLTEFITEINKDNNSHLVMVPSGVNPSDALLASPIMRGGAAAAMGEFGAAGGMDNGDFDYGGIDPSLDPELAMAIRASTEDFRASQAAAVGGDQQAGGASSGSVAVESGFEFMDEEEALLQRALQLSTLNDASTSSSSAPEGEAASSHATSSSSSSSSVEAVPFPAISASGAASSDDQDDEDEALAMALAMSMQSDQASSTDSVAPISASAAAANTETDGAGSSPFLDPAFVSQLLGSVDVDQNDPLILAALAQIGAEIPSGAPSSSSSSSSSSSEAEAENKKRKDGDRDNSEA